ncbi:MAG: hypothetical protein HYS87_00860 [Candidatus Colwellbacteria bacterium]|nr:hypothetical protein [Candidatus Colwellbacteria bacterium]
MLDFINLILNSGGFEPHSAHFIPNNIGLMWTLIIANILIGITYLVIPAELFYIYIKRKDFSFRWVFLVITVFGVWCSTSHFINALVFFYPAYYLAGTIDLGTGLISFASFVAYAVAVPSMLKLISPTKLREINKELSRQVDGVKKIEKELVTETLSLETVYKEISMKNSKLKEFNKNMITRELRIADLKKRIADKQSSL